MNLILISACSALTLLTYWFWQITAQREIRWKIFAIRDDLRWLAVTNPERYNSEQMLRFDATLSACAGVLHCTSLWTMLATKARAAENDAAREQFEADLAEAGEIRELYDRFGQVLMEHLRSRHWFITTLALVVHPLAQLIERFKVSWLPAGDRHARGGALA